MRFKYFLCCLSLVLFTGCVNQIKVPVEKQTTTYEQQVLGNDVSKVVMMICGPDEGTVSIKAKEKDFFVRDIENASVEVLRRHGYAVYLNLPENEVQNTSNHSTVKGQTQVEIDVIPYAKSSYIELAVFVNGDRYARLYDNSARNPKAVSNWVRRLKVSEGAI